MGAMLSETPLSGPVGPGPTEIAVNQRRATALTVVPTLVVFAVVTAVVGSLVSVVAGVVVGAIVGGAVGLAAWWGGAAVVFRLTGARSADVDAQPRVHNLIEGLCAASGTPRPSVRVVHDDAPNALAVGLHPRRATVVVTTGLVSALTRIELEAVLAHELSHVKGHDILPATVAVTSLGPLAVLVPPATGLLARAVGREREALADLAAVGVTRYPPGLISALEKLGAGGSQPSRPRGALARATDHLWIFPAASSPDERLQALREL